MGDFATKIYNSVLQLSILVFTSALVYFAFVYYPKAINSYKNAALPQKAFVPSAVAQFNKFPIETAGFRIIWEKSSDTYYIFVKGATLNEYVDNKNRADLAMKNALSETSLCSLNIIYSSTSKLQVPDKFQTRTGC